MEVKELSIEEKARRYNEAIEVINRCETDKYGCIIGIKPSDIFPELKESEDEKIREEIARFIRMEVEDEIVGNKWLAWLERQREQKIAEWSEEDERMYQSIMDDTIQENQLNDKQTNWLRDIKYRHFSQSQSRWRPSGEQMKFLWKYAEQNNYDGRILSWLYDDLKKLRMKGGEK